MLLIQYQSNSLSNSSNSSQKSPLKFFLFPFFGNIQFNLKIFLTFTYLIICSKIY